MATSARIAKLESRAGTITSARLLTPAQAAEVLGIPEGTLAQWRSQRRGPTFIKLEGRLVRYRVRDLDSYISGCVVEPVLNGKAASDERF
ncbi:MAG: helix-turn-helix domain-containing protein [Candidatus Acidiferrales bacterium]|jgi:predicted DNA-binding transcriptional regulator AlpA